MLPFTGPVRGIDFHNVQPLFVSGGDDYKIKVSLKICDCPCENLYKRSANANALVLNAVHSTGNEGECTKV